MPANRSGTTTSTAEEEAIDALVEKFREGEPDYPLDEHINNLRKVAANLHDTHWELSADWMGNFPQVTAKLTPSAFDRDVGYGWYRHLHIDPVTINGYTGRHLGYLLAETDDDGTYELLEGPTTLHTFGEAVTALVVLATRFEEQYTEGDN